MGRKKEHCRHEETAHAPQQCAQSAHRHAHLYLVLTLAGAVCALLSFIPRPPALLWNSSPSLPIGLYRLEQTRAIKGDIVVIAPDETLRDTLDAYDVLPDQQFLLKQLAARERDVVCRQAERITINGQDSATARLSASNGRSLPAWSGCRALESGQILALAPHPLSFDGRYVGPIDASLLVAVARPLLTFPVDGAS